MVASLKTATPEQLAWSVMQGLGLVAQTRLQVEEKLDGHDPKMRAILQTDARRRALRAHDDRGGRSRPVAKERHAVRAAVCRGGRPAPGRDRADGPPGPLPEQRPPGPGVAGSVGGSLVGRLRRLPILRPLPRSST